MKNLRGRPNQGKTATIRERCINIYLPTTELVDDWKKDAEKAGMSVSRFVMEVVENATVTKASPMMPNWQLEEKVKESENNLAALQEQIRHSKSSLPAQGGGRKAPRGTA